MSQQASEPDMTGILETADQEFKTTMINMLSTLIYKARQNAKTNEQCKQRDRNPNKEYNHPPCPKARDQKH